MIFEVDYLKSSHLNVNFWNVFVLSQSFLFNISLFNISVEDDNDRNQFFIELRLFYLRVVKIYMRRTRVPVKNAHEKKRK